MQQLGVIKLTLLGNSIGGAVAIEYASRHPAQVERLILANPGGLDPGGFIARLFIGNLEAHFHDGAEGVASFKPWFERYYDGILVTEAAKARKALIVEAGWESAPILEQAWHSFGQPEADLRAKAKGLSMPVLVTWASKDELIQWSRNREAVETIPKVRVVQLEAGHAPFQRRSSPRRGRFCRANHDALLRASVGQDGDLRSPPTSEAASLHISRRARATGRLVTTQARDDRLPALERVLVRRDPRIDGQLLQHALLDQHPQAL